MYRFDPGSTGQTVYYKLRDPSTGLAKTGVAYSTAGLVASYTRQRAAAINVPLVSLASAQAAYSAGGFVEVDSTLAPGLYRWDPPDAALAAGVPLVVAELSCSNPGVILAEPVLIRLDKNQSIVGSGAIAFTVNVVSSSNSQPLAGARCWVSTDVGGTNVIAGVLLSDSFGNVTFYLNAGTYYLWVQDNGYAGTNPTAITAG